MYLVSDLGGPLGMGGFRGGAQENEAEPSLGQMAGRLLR